MPDYWDTWRGNQPFNASEYLANKAEAINKASEVGYNPYGVEEGKWTGANVAQAFEKAGLTPEQHYQQYGITEGLSPTKKPTLATVEPYKAPAPWRPAEEETVQGRMSGLLSSGSPYITSAEEGAKRYAQSRGLLNTTMAATGGRKAAIESALPIAAQDAASFTQAGMAGYQGDIQAALKSQQYGQDIGTISAQEIASSRLSAQDAAEALDLSTQQESAQTLRQETELAVTQSMKAMDLTSSESRALGSAVTVLGQDLMGRIANIQVDPNLNSAAKTTIIQGLNASYRATVNSIASIYGVQIEWT